MPDQWSMLFGLVCKRSAEASSRMKGVVRGVRAPVLGFSFLE